MLVFNPEAQPAAVTRTFEPGLTFDLFPTGRKDRRRIRLEAAEMAAGDKEKEEKLFEDLLRRHMVRGWSGVIGVDGQPFAYAPEFVGPLLDTFTNLELWIVAQCETLAFDEAKKQAADLLN